MAARYSDQDIARLIEEQKPLQEDYRSRIQLRPKRGHKEQELDIQGANGSEFRLILRQSNFNPLDFSIILAYRPPNSNILFRLRRYNGRGHEHTNRIEGNKFYDFHIHMATQRYQELGMREDAYAEPTDRFSDFASALQCMLNDSGFDIPEDPQGRLFEEV
jgi:Family of unknown function (DUF6978)